MMQPTVTIQLPPLMTHAEQLEKWRSSPEHYLGALVREILSQPTTEPVDPQVENGYRSILGQPAQRGDLVRALALMRLAATEEQRRDAYLNAFNLFFGCLMYARKEVTWTSGHHLYEIAHQCAELAQAVMSPAGAKRASAAPDAPFVITHIYAGA